MIPEISIDQYGREDVLTISLTANGNGDDYSFDEVMKLT